MGASNPHERRCRGPAFQAGGLAAPVAGIFAKVKWERG